VSSDGGHTALVLGDQLMRDNPALEGAGRVLFVESVVPLARLRTHRQRVHLVLSAMRRFAAELRASGVEVVERRGAGSLAEGLEGFDDVVCAHPNSAGAKRLLARRGVRIVPTNQFLTQPDDLAEWAGGRRKLVMEPFYRRQRKRLGLLVDADGEPEGGRWNLDRENRRPPEAETAEAPEPWRAVEDEVDEEVRRALDALGVELWGLDAPRTWPATPEEARAQLEDFVEHRLARFGPWQDAILVDRPVLYHSLLSSSMNLGLLHPLEVVRRVEARYREGGIPLQSAEGYIRQVIGWREYMWGNYWLRIGDWARENALDAHLDLPDAYWSSGTGWHCLDATVDKVRETAYAHHIERLMVLGAIQLMAGVEPWQGVRWFQAAFIDGAEWVMAPNAAGMAMHATGDALLTKPYPASGNYVSTMSDHCERCFFDPHERHGERACPVTALYWDFLARHADDLAGNRRMRNQLRGLRQMEARGELPVLRERAARARAELQGAERP
jgi:deoxyribodipyrimidine photolyase-related protein